LGEDYVNIDDTLELLLARAKRAEPERDRLAEALRNLNSACKAADELGELYETITGDLMAEADAALASLEPGNSPEVQNSSFQAGARAMKDAAIKAACMLCAEGAPLVFSELGVYTHELGGFCECPARTLHALPLPEPGQAARVAKQGRRVSKDARDTSGICEPPAAPWK
jgi:hypothetical protein